MPRCWTRLPPVRWAAQGRSRLAAQAGASRRSRADRRAARGAGRQRRALQRRGRRGEDVRISAVPPAPTRRRAGTSAAAPESSRIARAPFLAMPFNRSILGTKGGRAPTRMARCCAPMAASSRACSRRRRHGEPDRHASARANRALHDLGLYRRAAPGAAVSAPARRSGRTWPGAISGRRGYASRVPTRRGASCAPRPG
jgi:hypothetical protein